MDCLTALAARAGAEHIKPALQRIYMTRASAYRDALKSFVDGYQEGVAEVMSKKADPEPKQAPDGPPVTKESGKEKMPL